MRDHQTDRGQLDDGPMLPVALLVVVVIVIVVGHSVWTAVDKQLEESNWAPEACEDQYGDNATWINDSDDVAECRLENGSVRNATLHLRGESHV